MKIWIKEIALFIISIIIIGMGYILFQNVAHIYYENIKILSVTEIILTILFILILFSY